MKILICGANGVVGRDLVYFLSKKHKILATYRNNKKNLFKNNNIKWTKCDFKNKINIKFKPEFIINCLATHTFSSKQNFIEYYNSHILSIFNLIEFSKKNLVKKIINFSSMNVYGKVTTGLVTEKEQPNNPDMVGITKFIGEKILKNTYSDIVNLRLPGILCIKNTKKYPIISRFIETLKKNNKITIYNKDALFNNVIDTFELSKLIERIFVKKKLKYKTFNVAASKPIKLNKVISLLNKKIKSKSKIVYLTKKNQSYLISTSKLKKHLNFLPSSTEKIIERNLYGRYS
jgi:nucleoside-diphosphate-sugar epimerase